VEFAEEAGGAEESNRGGRRGAECRRGSRTWPAAFGRCHGSRDGV